MLKFQSEQRMKNVLTLMGVVISLLAGGQNLEIRDGIYYKDNKPYSGPYKESGAGGKTTARLMLHKGQLNGRTILYDESGNKRELRSYHAGLKDGKWMTWTSAGHKMARAGYKDGLKHGNWYIWDEQGQLRYSMIYKDGNKTGTWRIWDEQGILVMEKSY